MKNILFVFALMLAHHSVEANKMIDHFPDSENMVLRGHTPLLQNDRGYLITPLATKIRENRKAERSKTHWIGYVAAGAVGVGLALTAPVSLIGGIVGAAGLLAFPRLKDFWTRLKRTL